jgi:hypothetical protein
MTNNALTKLEQNKSPTLRGWGFIRIEQSEAISRTAGAQS